MFPALERQAARYAELEKQLLDADVLSNVPRMLEIRKEMGSLAKIAAAVRRFHSLEGDIDAAKMMVDEETDHEAREYARGELSQLQAQHRELSVELEDMATAGDSITRGACIMEIRAGTGGDEAALFAKDLYDMYLAWCGQRGWKTELLEFSPTELGGLKEVVSGPFTRCSLRVVVTGCSVSLRPSSRGGCIPARPRSRCCQRLMKWKLTFARRTWKLIRCVRAVRGDRKSIKQKALCESRTCPQALW